MAREGTIVDVLAAPTSLKTGISADGFDPEGDNGHSQSASDVVRVTPCLGVGADSQRVFAGDEQVVYGDKAYVDAQRQATMPTRLAKRVPTARLIERVTALCAGRTSLWRILKHLWGYRKVRYRGLAKNAAQLFTLPWLMYI